jgi:hypothetical protein
MLFKYILICTILVPFVGWFRRPYIKYKFNKYNITKNESTEIKLKESIAKFAITME